MYSAAVSSLFRCRGLLVLYAWGRLCVGCSAEAPWRMLLQEGRHRAPLGHSMVLPSSVPPIKWKVKTYGSTESSPVVGDRHVFSAAGKEIIALDKATGEKVWAFKTRGAILASGALGGGMFMVGSDDKHFYAVDEATGKLRWKFKADEFTGGATIGEPENVVYVGSSAKKLHAYFLNGSKHFEFKTKDKVCSTPALDDSGVYFGDDSGAFFKLDRATGKKVWDVKFPSGVRSPARLEPDGIYLSFGDPDGTKSGEIVRLGYDGKVHWRSDCKWQGRKVASKCMSCWTSPAVVGDVAIAGCGLDTKNKGAVWGLDKETGEVRWKVEADNDCQTSSPVAVGDSVLIGCIDGSLRAIKAADGAEKWVFNTPKLGIWATTALDADGTIFIGAQGQAGGYLYALGGAARQEL